MEKIKVTCTHDLSWSEVLNCARVLLDNNNENNKLSISFEIAGEAFGIQSQFIPNAVQVWRNSTDDCIYIEAAYPCDGEKFTLKLEDFSVRDVLCIVDELLRLKGGVEISLQRSDCQKGDRSSVSCLLPIELNTFETYH